ncbi:ATP-binding protein [Vitiosangium sp. GDMCC 1.1324]|uniref:ATP-binding protein n=1 Tax=Vitiosangium sp. (strain GDMCC 1.1324) TaxID=2138576 RepID=UPI000D3B8DA7|nr:ATP-binding protein [Vitiosangium sp. GDMCC 1.1324]PTL78133.1 histidine kinase [Vitiosangium sp. GDMCC 1.1324]
MPPLPQGSAPVSRDRSGALTGGQASAEETLRASHQLLRVLTEVQADVLRGGEPRAAFERMLAVVLELTGSASGVIGEVLPSPGGTPSFRPVASLPPDETSASWELPVPHEPPGPEPRDLRALVGAVSTTGRPVLSGGPGAERTFLGLPLESGGECLGVVGLAQRPGGYEAELIDFLQPFLLVCGSLLIGWRNEQRRRQTEQELRHAHETSEERLRLLMDNMQDGVWDMDMPTGRLVTNRRWWEMLGYAESELETSYATWAHLSHPGDATHAERLVTEHLKGNLARVEHEQRLRHKNGEWVWVLTRAKVVTRDEQGYPVRMVGTNVDITARKLGEERLQALVSAIPDIVFRIGADGTYRDFHGNKNVEMLIPAEKIIGTNLRDLPLSKPVLDKSLMHLARAVREGTLEVFEYVLDMPQSGRRHYEMRLTRCGPDEVISIIRDITERKLSEERLLQQDEELRRHRDSLEALVRTRSEKLLQATLELEEQQAQLIQTEKLASLGQMAAGVAHEINNPISYVMSNLGSLDQYVSSLTPLLQLQRELLTPREEESGGAPAELLERMRELWQREDVEYILGDMPEIIEESLVGTRRIKEIAQSLRSFAREDSGEPQLVDVNTEMASTLKIVWNELKYKCEVKRDFGPLPPVSCHPTQISQVFTNLLVNAAQAIETRGEIRIRTRHEGNEVVVEVADTGKGMTQETISKLFTPFFTTKPRGQGTGLGLSVSYGIISKHQGRIEVQSEPGKGSTFTIRLPAAQR